MEKMCMMFQIDLVFEQIYRISYVGVEYFFFDHDWLQGLLYTRAQFHL